VPQVVPKPISHWIAVIRASSKLPHCVPLCTGPRKLESS
jgi:hypothetical protein